MLRSRSTLLLGMPHTRMHAMSEVALLAHCGDLRWHHMARVAGLAATRQRDADGRAVYASFYYIEVEGFPDAGLAAYGPDDVLDFVSQLGRFGRSMMDGEVLIFPHGSLSEPLPQALPAAPRVRLSNVLVALGSGADDLKIATPANADVERIPSFAEEPDSYRIIKRARQEGRFYEAPDGAERLWQGARSAEYTVNPDRDVNGVGLLYFANFVVFMDHAERALLSASGALAPEEIDRRVTVRRRIGYYGNARPSDRIDVETEALALPGRRLLFHHRVSRRSDGRLIAVSSVEKHLAGAERDRPAVGVWR
jgi:probable biosynthetic protein (TIGR04098 family)